MRVFLFIFVGIALSGCDKLDRTYLPPPGSKYAGGSAGDLETPLEFPKEKGPDTTGYGNQDFVKPTPGHDSYQPPFDTENRFVSSPQLDLQGSDQPESQQDLYPQSQFNPSPQSPNVQNKYNVPVTTTSYAFTQTTTFPPGQGDFETSTGPTIGIPGSDSDAQRIIPQVPFVSSQNIPGPENYQQNNGQNQGSPFLPHAHSIPPNYAQPPQNNQLQSSYNQPGITGPQVNNQEPLQNIGQQTPYGIQDTFEPGPKSGSSQYVGQPNNHQTTASPNFSQGSFPSTSDYQPSNQNGGQFDHMVPFTASNFQKPQSQNQFQGSTGNNQLVLPNLPNRFSLARNQSQQQFPIEKPVQNNQPSFLPINNHQKQYSESNDFVRLNEPDSNNNQNQYSSVSPTSDLSTRPQFSTTDKKDENPVNDRYSHKNQPGTPSITQQPYRPGGFSTSSASPISPENYTPDTNGNIQQPNILPVNKPERAQAEGDRNAVILNYENVLTPEGEFLYSFDTSNGIHADESGTSKDGVKAQGSYSYIGDDGKVYSVIYSADENGFLPRGDHLPTPPPIPEAILRVIEQAQKDQEAGIYHDGSYDEGKYGYKKYESDQKRQRMKDHTRFQNRPVSEYSDTIHKDQSGQYQDEPETQGYYEFPTKTPTNASRQPLIDISDDMNEDIVIGNMNQRLLNGTKNSSFNKRPGGGFMQSLDKITQSDDEKLKGHQIPSTRPTQTFLDKHFSTDNFDKLGEDKQNEYVNRGYQPKQIGQEPRPSVDINEDTITKLQRPSSPDKPVIGGLPEPNFDEDTENLEQDIKSRTRQPQSSTSRPNTEVSKYEYGEQENGNQPIIPTSRPINPVSKQQQSGNQNVSKAESKIYKLNNKTPRPENRLSQKKYDRRPSNEFSNKIEEQSLKPQINIGPIREYQQSKKQPSYEIVRQRPSTTYNGAVNEYLPGQSGDIDYEANDNLEVNNQTLFGNIISKSNIPKQPTEQSILKNTEYSDKMYIQPSRNITTKYEQIKKSKRPNRPKISISNESGTIDDTSINEDMADLIPGDRLINAGQNESQTLNQLSPTFYSTQKVTMENDESETGYEYVPPQQVFIEGFSSYPKRPFQNQLPTINSIQPGVQNKGIRPFMTPNVPRTDLGTLDDNRPSTQNVQTPYVTSDPSKHNAKNDQSKAKPVTITTQDQFQYNAPNFEDNNDSSGFTGEMKIQPQVSYETGTTRKPIFGQRLPNTSGIVQNNQQYPVTERNRYDQRITQNPTLTHSTQDKIINYSTTPMTTQSTDVYRSMQSTPQRVPSHQEYKYKNPRITQANTQNPYQQDNDFISSTTPIPSQDQAMYGSGLPTSQRGPFNQGYRNQYSTTAMPYLTDSMTSQPGYVTDRITKPKSIPSDATRNPETSFNGFISPGRQEQNTFGNVPSTTLRPSYSIVDSGRPSSPVTGSTTLKYAPVNEEFQQGGRNQYPKNQGDKPFQQDYINQYPSYQGYSTQQPIFSSTSRPGYSQNDISTYSTDNPDNQDGYKQFIQSGTPVFGQTGLPQGSVFPNKGMNQNQAGYQQPLKTTPSSVNINQQKYGQDQRYPGTQFETPGPQEPTLVPQGAFESFHGPSTEANKVLGEDFSGPKQPQYFDPKTGYHY